MNRIKIALLFFSFLVISLVARANDITVSNVSLTGRVIAGANSSTNYTMVKFDLSWANSWRTSSAPNNWDAAWVFVKYRVVGGNWQHAKLNSSGHIEGTGTAITISPGLLTPSSPFNSSTNPAVGVFIHRSSDGSGTLSVTSTQIRWNYGENGVPDDASVEVKVFAIEMVYVPTGSFKLGSLGIHLTNGGSFTFGTWTSAQAVASFEVTGSPITIGQSSGNLWGTSSTSGATIGPAGALPTSFPTGYSAFYCMKYELSQGMYRDFLNMLTITQQLNRTSGRVLGVYALSNQSTVVKRSGIRIVYLGSSPAANIYACDATTSSNPNPSADVNQIDDGESIPCNYLLWEDVIAFLDWSGLRPMTELEYEKACRGTENSVSGEFAWGHSAVSRVAHTLSNVNTPSEAISAGYSGNSSTGNTRAVPTSGTNSVQGPLRSGIFAAHSSNSPANRSLSGASFYGIMELTGNLFEYTVSVGSTTGRQFTGNHGDGSLDNNGNANTSNWPNGSSPYGFGTRGGSFGTAPYGVSDRGFAIFTYNISRPSSDEFGCRGVRIQ